ncbi:GH92 family glycosyl hydrolase [Arachidicoccus soli]|uniref:Glycoside hydrolase family 92 protein n=1 Tax=Arachidicoccus soli TaxID=2341117 RepID=A0A386HPG8_9BACT|nr:GH92 family glycosyl hydrolase [Arachidicoccus soli]AYD47331.1 glycoside hydrolase family 92 protein [Arachidicoccus soli]
MKISIRTGLFMLSMLLMSQGLMAQNLLKYVDPNLGAANCRWFFYTPGAVPYGMAKLAPSTNGHYGNAQGWEAVGYDTRQNSIEGFVFFHEWQIGGVSFMPTTGSLKVKPGDLDTPDNGYRSHFEHKNEVAQPGYYKVLLDRYHITTELTATKRVGFQRYTFPASDQSHILLDIGNVQGESGQVTDAGIHMIDATRFEGFVNTYPKYVQKYDPQGKVMMFFYGELSKAPASVGSFNEKGITQNSKTANGKGAGLFLNYKTTANEKIEIKVGLSYTSEANAQMNLKVEAANLTFNQAKIKAQQIWQHELSKLTIEGTNDTDKIKFYTGLYHVLLGRGVASDVNGDYPMHEGKIGHMPPAPSGKTYNFINTDAIWGGYWDITQLWALSYPETYEDFIHTQLQVYKDKGWFGDGLANSEYVSGVGTNFVGLTIAAAYELGIRDYNINLAYQAVKANELGWKNRKPGSGKMDVKAFVKYGYVPFLEGDGQNFVTDSTGSNFSASHTLEYSFSAFAAAQMAKSLGKTDDYKKLMKYSNGWRYLYNPVNKLIEPKKADGKFISKFDPYAPWRGYQEGNAMQYTFFVPQNPKELIALQGKSYFNNNLNDIFDKSEKDDFGGGKKIDAFAGVTSIYNHGNEPSLHISWLFNFSGKPWLTQKWTRAICDDFYGIESVHGYGYGQDEDQGQMGGWYVMAALGLFDVKGFTDQRPIIELGSPIFDKAKIKLGNGRELLIETKNNSKENFYVQSVLFNGKAIQNCWLYRDQLMHGGKLVFTMGDQPNKNWGIKTPPPSIQ